MTFSRTLLKTLNDPRRFSKFEERLAQSPQAEIAGDRPAWGTLSAPANPVSQARLYKDKRRDR
jgi:hypothetical protein